MERVTRSVRFVTPEVSDAVKKGGVRTIVGVDGPTAPKKVPELGCKRAILEPPVTQYKRIGIDTSKAVFTLHGIDETDRPILRINLRRAQMVSFFRKLAPTVVALEACASAHYWARELKAFGHKVLLVPPQYVAPYVKRGKNDRNDAEAICEAAGRPGMHFVPVKSVARQAQGMVLKVRETLVGQRVALINTVRGFLLNPGSTLCPLAGPPQWLDRRRYRDVQRYQ